MFLAACCVCAPPLQSDALRGSGIRFIFIENMCNDPDILQQNYLNKMMYSPDYKGIPTRKVLNCWGACLRGLAGWLVQFL
jgi:hypothetical protein